MHGCGCAKVATIHTMCMFLATHSSQAGSTIVMSVCSLHMWACCNVGWSGIHSSTMHMPTPSIHTQLCLSNYYLNRGVPGNDQKQ